MDRRKFLKSSFIALVATPITVAAFESKPSQNLTLALGEFSERYIKPAMIEMANSIDRGDIFTIDGAIDDAGELQKFIVTDDVKVNS